jgi:hypothetical protein
LAHVRWKGVPTPPAEFAPELLPNAPKDAKTRLPRPALDMPFLAFLSGEGGFEPPAPKTDTSPTPGGGKTVKYKVHRFDLKMTRDQSKLEQFLNGLDGEVVAIVPNVTLHVLWAQKVDFLFIVEKIGV